MAVAQAAVIATGAGIQHGQQADERKRKRAGEKVHGMKNQELVSGIISTRVLFEGMDNFRLSAVTGVFSSHF